MSSDLNIVMNSARLQAKELRKKWSEDRQAPYSELLIFLAKQFDGFANKIEDIKAGTDRQANGVDRKPKG